MGIMEFSMMCVVTTDYNTNLFSFKTNFKICKNTASSLTVFENSHFSFKNEREVILTYGRIRCEIINILTFVLIFIVNINNPYTSHKQKLPGLLNNK